MCVCGLKVCGGGLKVCVAVCVASVRGWDVCVLCQHFASVRGDAPSFGAAAAGAVVVVASAIAVCGSEEKEQM